jgi:hypothetical protein
VIVTVMLESASLPSPLAALLVLAGGASLGMWSTMATPGSGWLARRLQRRRRHVMAPLPQPDPYEARQLAGVEALFAVPGEELPSAPTLEMPAVP